MLKFHSSTTHHLHSVPGKLSYPATCLRLERFVCTIFCPNSHSGPSLAAAAPYYHFNGPLATVIILPLSRIVGRRVVSLLSSCPVITFVSDSVLSNFQIQHSTCTTTAQEAAGEEMTSRGQMREITITGSLAVEVATVSAEVLQPPLVVGEVIIQRAATHTTSS